MSHTTTTHCPTGQNNTTLVKNILLLSLSLLSTPLWAQSAILTSTGSVGGYEEVTSGGFVDLESDAFYWMALEVATAQKGKIARKWKRFNKKAHRRGRKEDAQNLREFMYQVRRGRKGGKKVQTLLRAYNVAVTKRNADPGAAQLDAEITRRANLMASRQVRDLEAHYIAQMALKDSALADELALQEFLATQEVVVARQLADAEIDSLRDRIAQLNDERERLVSSVNDHSRASKSEAAMWAEYMDNSVHYLAANKYAYPNASVYFVGPNIATDKLMYDFGLRFMRGKEGRGIETHKYSDEGVVFSTGDGYVTVAPFVEGGLMIAGHNDGGITGFESINHIAAKFLAQELAEAAGTNWYRRAIN